MENSNAMIFATSEASPSSKWMPWELGFFDGKRGADKVAILPLVDTEGKEFRGQEYLALYGRVERRDLQVAKALGLMRMPSNLSVLSTSRGGGQISSSVTDFVRGR
jgi:hypothetical protein